jgi:cytochrome b6-f complex iron-sulfur subunit
MTSRQVVERNDRSGAPPGEALKALRDKPVQGISRRELLRRSLGGAVALWLTEVVAGPVGFLWPNVKGGFGGVVKIGDIQAAIANPAVQGSTGAFTNGAPAYFQAARSYVVLINPDRGFFPGGSPAGDGAATNVRTLYQRCTHLGCKPNFCTRNFWFECPCHGSRYDRLGIKVARLGPAPRGLDRFASTVDENGVLTIDTSKITLGPLPVALGQPGVIPPRSPMGCL